LQELEAETGRRVHAVLQLRVHPEIVALRSRILQETSRVPHEVCLTYITARGRWYDVSWKGVDERSGGLVTNVGVHLFDLLIWLFGPMQHSEVHVRQPRMASGFMELEHARVRWLLSAERGDLPVVDGPRQRTSFRSITVDDKEVEFTEGFADLHTRVYEHILAGRGFGIDDARPAIVLTHHIRHATPEPRTSRLHPMLSEAR
jgi:UDP-N-acetyl-2-amino-2-deoxyglucuronate dehydrogenase